MAHRHARTRKRPHPIQLPREKAGLLLLCIVYLALAWAWNVTLPAYENLDELEHAEFVRHVVTTGRLPVHGDAEARGYRVRQEASQPPLYYLLAAGWAGLWRLPTAPHDPQAVPDPVVACGPSPTFYNKMTWIHTPAEARLPWDGAFRTLHSLRLLSTLLQGLTLIGAWALARRATSHPTGPLLVTAFVGLNPQFLMVAAGVNNDNAVVPLATWGLVLALDLWQRGPSVLRIVGLGLLGGLAALSKLSGFGLIGLGGLVLLIEGISARRPLTKIAAHGLLLLAPALLLVTPWLWRNQQLYGDPTALAPMLEEVGVRSTGVSLGEAWLMVRSYWGQLPCTFYPRALYWPFVLYVIGGVAGLLVNLAHRRPHHRTVTGRALALSGVWFATIVLAWIRWNRMTFATGGRLLFPAASAVALLLAVTWRSWGRHVARIWAAVLPLASLAVLIFGLLPIAVAPPIDAPQQAAAPSFSFGERVTLHDHRAQIVQPRVACALKSASYCGPALDLDLHWSATTPPAENWTMVVQLVSPVPGGTDLRLNYNHWPGRGILPTSVWPAGEIIHDHYRIPLGEDASTTRAWSVRVAFVDPQSGNRVPVRAGDEPSGDAAHLALLRVPDGNPRVPTETGDGTLDVEFGAGIRLLYADVTAMEAESWHVDLVWESLAPVSEDYVIFVHAYDEDGGLLATGDGPPLQGGFPTRLWEPGDRIATSHSLVPDEGTPAVIAVGLYDPATGQRLPAASDDVPVDNDAASIWRAP